MSRKQSLKTAPHRGRFTRWFRLAAVLAPAVLLLLAEAALRLAGFGGYPPLWKPALVKGKSSTLFETNPGALTVFFSNPGAPRRNGLVLQGDMRFERVLMPKPKSLLRVAMLGESSVEGFPYPRNLTAASFLEASLQQRYPRRKIEVLNLGVTAAASFPLREVARQTLDTLDLDLLVIYTGHNEFFGAGGVASTQAGGHSLASQHFFYWLRSLALYQGLEHLTRRQPAAETAGDQSSERAQLIERMARQEAVPPAGELHARAAQNFSANLSAIVRQARARGVPVLLATVASNEADLAPIRCWAEPPQTIDEITSQARRTLAQTSLTLPAALAQLEALRQRAHHHAMPPYAMAHLLQRDGQTSRALPLFQQARDEDAMPWRAPRLINDTIRQTATHEGLPLVDVEAVFHAASQGAIGWNLMADHLHPNLDGQALLARTLCEAITSHALLRDPDLHAPLPSPDQLTQILGANRLEEVQVLGTMQKLFSHPPLSQNNEGLSAWFHQRQLDATASLNPIEREAIDKWNIAQAQSTRAPSISYIAGQAAMENLSFAQAAQYFQNARGSFTPYGAMRLRSQYLGLLCLRQLGPFKPPQQWLLNLSLSEAVYVESLTEPDDMGLLYDTIGGLHILNRDAQRGRQYLKLAFSKQFQPGDAEAQLLNRLIQQDAALRPQ
jgi:lysophospholipase L1-like esterase